MIHFHHQSILNYHHLFGDSDTFLNTIKHIILEAQTATTTSLFGRSYSLNTDSTSLYLTVSHISIWHRNAKYLAIVWGGIFYVATTFFLWCADELKTAYLVWQFWWRSYALQYVHCTHRCNFNWRQTLKHMILQINEITVKTFTITMRSIQPMLRSRCSATRPINCTCCSKWQRNRTWRHRYRFHENPCW